MTLAEAMKLAKVFATADGGCSSCVQAICAEANAMELGFKWTYINDYSLSSENRVDVDEVKS